MSFVKKIGLELQKIYQRVVDKLNSLKGSQVEIAKGFATGGAVSFTPFVGFHLLICIIITKLTKQNTIASALGTIVGNPWTFPFIWYATLKTGHLILGHHISDKNINFKEFFSKLFHAVISLDFDAFISDIWPVFYPMLVGCIPFCIIVWAILYYLIKQVLIKDGLKEEKK